MTKEKKRSAGNSGKINYTEAFEKPFIKQNMKTMLIGLVVAAFSIIPFIGFVFSWTLMGLLLESTGLGKTKAGKKMPEWKKKLIVPYFIKGAANTAISLIYMIPAIIVFALGAGSVVIGIIKNVPWDQLANKTEEEASAVISSVLQSMAPQIEAAIPFMIISALLLLFALYITPMAVLSYIRSNRFVSAFDFKGIMRKAFSWKYLVALLVYTGVLIVLSSLLGLIPYIGSPIAVFVGGVIGMSLLGQSYLILEKKDK